MRYQTQIQILEEALPLLKVESHPINGERGIKITTAKDISEAMDTLSQFSYLNPELKDAFDIDSLQNVKSSFITVSDGTYSVINSKIANLKSKIQQSLKVLKETVVEQTELTISIKLKEYASLKDIASELTVLDTIINQVITNKDIDGSYTFSSFDIGSSWINITVGTAVVMQLLASLTWSACVFRKKWYEGSLLKEKVKQLSIKSDTLSDIETALKSEINQLAVAEAKNIIAEHKLDESDNEYQKRLEHSIVELSKLILDGVEVHPSLLAPEESKNLFPEIGRASCRERV